MRAEKRKVKRGKNWPRMNTDDTDSGWWLVSGKEGGTHSRVAANVADELVQPEVVGEGPHRATSGRFAADRFGGWGRLLRGGSGDGEGAVRGGGGGPAMSADGIAAGEWGTGSRELEPFSRKVPRFQPFSTDYLLGAPGCTGEKGAMTITLRRFDSKRILYGADQFRQA